MALWGSKDRGIHRPKFLYPDNKPSNNKLGANLPDIRIFTPAWYDVEIISWISSFDCNSAFGSHEHVTLDNRSLSPNSKGWPTVLPYESGTVESVLSDSSGETITSTGHNLKEGDLVQFSTSGGDIEGKIEVIDDDNILLPSDEGSGVAANDTWTMDSQAYGLTVRGFDGHYPAGDYKIVLRGKGTVEFKFDTASNQTTEFTATGPEETHTLTLEPSNSGLNVLITNLPDPNDPIEIEAYMPGFDQPGFHPQLIDHVKTFSVLRFMDLNNINDSNMHDWSYVPSTDHRALRPESKTRTGNITNIVDSNEDFYYGDKTVEITSPDHGLVDGQKISLSSNLDGFRDRKPAMVIDKDTFVMPVGDSYSPWTGDTTGTWEVSIGNGAPYEWLCRLCNTVKTDAWFCIPHAVDDDFIVNMAQKIDENLDESLSIWIEYSNEVWNTIFQGQHYKVKRVADDAGVSFDEGYATEANRRIDIFENALSSRRKLHRVISGQAANSSRNSKIINTVANEGLDFDYFSVAPYFKGDGATEEAIMDAAIADIDDSVTHIEESQSAIDSAGLTDSLKLCCYEGGQHIVGDENRHLDVQYNSRMREAMDEYFNRIIPKIDLFCIFNYISLYNRNGSWGYLQYSDQTEEDNPKWASLMSQMRKQRKGHDDTFNATEALGIDKSEVTNNYNEFGGPGWNIQPGGNDNPNAQKECLAWVSNMQGDSDDK